MRRSMADHGTPRLGRISAIFPIVLLSAFILACPPSGQAQVNSQWNGGTGNWNVATNWTPNSFFPNNGNGGNTYNVDIGGAGGSSNVTLNVSVTIDNLTLDNSNQVLGVNQGEDLTLVGTSGTATISNGGSITVNGGGGSNTVLLLDANTTLSGTGTLTLSTATGGGNAFIEQGVGGVTLTNSSTIQGNGVIGNGGLTLNNSGTVNANVSGGTLLLDPTGGITNTGSLQASNGGTLEISAITVNNAGGNITSSSGSTVELVGSAVIQGGTLNSNGGTLETPGGQTATLDGSTAAGAVTINGTYTSDLNSETILKGTITNAGNVQVNGGSGNNTVLAINANTTLNGGGTVTLSTASGGGNAIIEQGVGGVTLTNSSTIQGNGVIGNGGLTLNNSGTVNANVSGGTLLLNGTGGITNTGSLQASNGGTLEISGITVNNAGGNISSSGSSTVQLVNSAVVQGGTLNSNGGTLGTPLSTTATLDGSTVSGAVTISGTYTSDLNSETILKGTITNNGNIQVNAGSGNNTDLFIGGNTTLQGGGTVTLSTVSGTGTAFILQNAGGLTLTNVNNTIQGEGTVGNGGLTLVNQSTVNANVSGGTLLLNGTGGITNTGSLQASNGGTLEISAITVNNAGGNITSSSGSVVELVNSAVVQGGTLNSNGGTLGTPGGTTATLDGSTGAGAVTISGTYTSGLDSETILKGTITNNGNIQVNAGSGNNTDLFIGGNTTLQGGGTVTLSTVSGTGTAFILQNAGGLTLTNVNNTIQGEGTVGNGGLTLVNQATVNANASGGTLLLNGSGGITNTGTLQASNGGTLEISAITVNNAGGNITSSSGSTVELVNSAVIQGGTLNSNGGTFGTPGGNTAILDGSTVSGAVTISGTYTSGLDSETILKGTITNTGNIQVNAGSGNNTDLALNANTTLNGGGTVTLSTVSGTGTAFIVQNSGGLTLTNFNNTIQGAGTIGDGGLTLLNQSGGTILANVSGQTLLVNGSGGATNSGTFQASSGSSLIVTAPLTNFSGTTLNGGTYNVFSGTMQLPGNINTNAATILLDGATGTPHLNNGSGTNALANFATNAASGIFTIQNGVSLTSAASSDFSNAGTMTIGNSSTFTVGGSHNFDNTGTLLGTGTLVATNLINSGGTVMPGFLGTAGVLSVTGNYVDPQSFLSIQIGGPNAGLGGYSQLDVSGSASLGSNGRDAGPQPAQRLHADQWRNIRYPQLGKCGERHVQRQLDCDRQHHIRCFIQRKRPGWVRRRRRAYRVRPVGCPRTDIAGHARNRDRRVGCRRRSQAQQDRAEVTAARWQWLFQARRVPSRIGTFRGPGLSPLLSEQLKCSLNERG